MDPVAGSWGIFLQSFQNLNWFRKCKLHRWSWIQDRRRQLRYCQKFWARLWLHMCLGCRQVTPSELYLIISCYISTISNKIKLSSIFFLYHYSVRYPRKKGTQITPDGSGLSRHASICPLSMKEHLDSLIHLVVFKWVWNGY